MPTHDASREPTSPGRRRTAKDLLGQRLAALFGAGCLLFNFPLLALWDRAGTFLGVPLFPAALFLIWIGLIAALGLMIERGAVSADDADRPAGGHAHGVTVDD